MKKIYKITFGIIILILPKEIWAQSMLNTDNADEDSIKIITTHDTAHTSCEKQRLIGIDCEQVDSFVRIENLEIGINNAMDFAFFMQCQFPINEVFSGRLFLSSFRVNKKHVDEKVGHFSTGAIDLTIFKFPIDLSFGIDNDRLGHNPYRRSEFLGTTLYLSDMKKFHKVFHIFRYSTGYHFYHKGESDTSTQRNGMQHSIFIQTQPLRYKNSILSTETYFLSRGKTSLLEIDLGLRHKKILDERLILGTTVSFENYHFHAVYGFLRFSLIQTAPKKGKNW